MRYGFLIPGVDLKEFGGLAALAEASGWDGVFVADGLSLEHGGKPIPWFDPWIALAAMAVATERVKLGTVVTPVPRRRPWKLAREIETLDHLSGGRMILSVGLGAAEDDGGFCKVGEAMELKVRAELLDEGLEIMNGLWKGKPVTFKGKHYQVDGLAMQPRPVQKPRVPIWVVGVWPKEKSMRRAVRWDGVHPQPYGVGMADFAEYAKKRYAEDIRAIKEYVAKHHRKPESFDIIAQGFSSGKNLKKAIATVKPLEEAGATWYIENLWSGDLKAIRARIEQGPPK
ncbi:MAG TPA: LLM class flavin-dependent oxidoreductase [Blastocatellia bacterium]|jgi:alkanesulfonate monooxygenase SsuD/methylene tetrahydromethanopterin reductase-like flavin-dependent oxidoreductase (luciferase family)|nr:LLM class flavin-dependent oxidoreductase [Blastocatellia bacterium]